MGHCLFFPAEAAASVESETSSHEGYGQAKLVLRSMLDVTCVNNVFMNLVSRCPHEHGIKVIN